MKGINSIKEASNKDYIDTYTYILIISDVTNQREVYDLPTISKLRRLAQSDSIFCSISFGFNSNALSTTAIKIFYSS